jgi:alkylation response protein AidB-like acyl-CoA dehydrogenase
MNFGLTSEQLAMRDHVKDLLDKECSLAYVTQCDELGKPPREAFKALADHGWLGLIAPEEYGGVSGSATDLAVLLEETGHHFEELGLWLFRSYTFGCYAILKNGTEEQKKFFLPKTVSGAFTYAFALTEPDSGSDAAALRTKAEIDGDHFVINGRKQFISGFDIADYALVALRTSQGAKKQMGISTLLIDTKTPGIEAKRIPTLGQHSIGTTEVTFTQCARPPFFVVGRARSRLGHLRRHLAL